MKTPNENQPQQIITWPEVAVELISVAAIVSIIIYCLGAMQ